MPKSVVLELLDAVKRLECVQASPKLGAAMTSFLTASMDEVRLHFAGVCIRELLKLTDHDDADYFRTGVLRRELSGDVSYPQQRDHSAHTLNNYLLGWYFFLHCPAWRARFEEHCDFRGVGSGSDAFQDVWEFVSVLHDIGYLFEGSVGTLSAKLQAEQVAVGAEVLREYFHHRLWLELGIGSVEDRRILLQASGVELPSFSSSTQSSVADDLRQLGTLEVLRSAAKAEADAAHLRRGASGGLAKAGGVPGDAFSLWRTNYYDFGNANMASRIGALERYFEDLLHNGIRNSGLRILDHGVCSGLLILQYCTFYFRLHFGLLAAPVGEVADRGRGLLGDRIGAYQALWWWQGIAWGAAACALHNAQQQVEFAALHGALPVDDDPLAYLGIMVDIIQEWDRYTVSREGVFSGRLPLQGVDVKLSHKDGSIEIDMGDAARSSKVVRDLDTALVGWRDFLSVR